MTATATLSTFGGLAILRNGQSPGGAAGQRRPLAVLAMVAASGEAGISRDKITSILWPDADEERARRALAQAVYSLRRALKDCDVFTGVADLRLNREEIEADVAEFDDAFRSQRFADAVTLYRGRFCDGFAIPNAAEFDRWLESQRAHYHARCTTALKRLIISADRDKRVDVAIEWARQLFSIDPLDSTAAVLLVDRLRDAGDVAGAMNVARRHEAEMRSQLDLPVSREIDERVRDLARVSSSSAATALPPRIVASPASGDSSGMTVETMPSNQPSRRISAGSETSSRTDHFPRRVVGGVTLVAALAVLALAIPLTRKSSISTAAAAPPTRDGVVAILPFQVKATDGVLAFLGEGSADLMARMLTGPDGPRAVDPGAVLAVLDSLPAQGLIDPGEVQLHARSVARRLGAAEVLLGRVSGTPSSLSISGTVVDVQSGKERASAVVTGSLDSLASLIETLAARLVAQTTIGRERANAFSNARLKVLNAYLRAESEFHDDNYRNAVRLYEQALAQDSTFAPAALGLAMSADRMNTAEQHDRGLALAWAARDRLSEVDKAYLDALAGPQYPRPSSVGEQLAAWENVVTLSPDRASAWTGLGERFLYDGDFLGIRNADERALGAFRRALELDPGDTRALRNMVQLAAKTGDVGTLTRLPPAKLDSIGGEQAGYLRWRVAIARGDTAELRRVRAMFPKLPDGSLRLIAMSSQNEFLAMSDGERAIRLLAARAVLATDQLDVLLAEHSLAMNRRRTVLALDVTERIQDAQPGSRAHLRLRVLDALYGEGDPSAAQRAVVELENLSRQTPVDGYSTALRQSDLCVLGQWYAAPWNVTGQYRPASKIASVVGELREASPWSRTVPLAAAPKACASIIDAMHAVSSRSKNAREKVVALDNMMLSGPALGDATVWATLATARLYDRLGDRQRALAVVKQRSFMKGWPRYRLASMKFESELDQPSQPSSRPR